MMGDAVCSASYGNWRGGRQRPSSVPMAAEAGRAPKSITISVYGQPPDGAAVRSYLDAGADRVVGRRASLCPLDSRFRGNDGGLAGMIGDGGVRRAWGW